MKENFSTSFSSGFLTNVLNPKATLFFLSVFTQIIDPQTPAWIQILYGIEMMIATFLWFFFIGSMISSERFRSKFDRFQSKLIPCFGIFLILLALKIAFVS